MSLRIGILDGALASANGALVARRLGAETVAVGAAPTGTEADAAALRAALLAGEVDAVVHSFSELPIDRPSGIVLAAVPKRADARDALCTSGGRDLGALPAGSRVGVTRPLRRAQLAAQRAELIGVDVVGDLDALLGRLDADDAGQALDAVVVSAADLDVLDRGTVITERWGLESWPTAPGQGALVVETRASDARLVAKLDHKPSRLSATAEHGVAARIGAGCAPYLAASALFEDGLLFLSARVYAPDGTAQLTASHALYPEDVRDPAAELAARVADELLAAGAAELVAGGGLS